MSHQWSSELWDWPLEERGDGTVHCKDRRLSWEVDLPAGGFRADEIDVNYINGELNIHCEHGAYNVQRNYRLPEDIDPSTIRSGLGRDGVLRVTAMKRY